MNELSACQAPLEQVKAITRKHVARGVARIKIPVGPLSGVESCLLKQAFPIASAGSIAEGAELILEDLPVCKSIANTAVRKPAPKQTAFSVAGTASIIRGASGVTNCCWRAWNSRNVAANRHCQVVE